MSRSLFLGAPSWAGTWHRFRALNHALPFARDRKYQLNFLWSLSGGVSYCRFEDLFSQIPGVNVHNVAEHEVDRLEAAFKRADKLAVRDQLLSVFRRGRAAADKMLVFDLAAAEALEENVLPEKRPAAKTLAIPSPEIRQRAGAFIRKHDLPRRLGIRVRVTECPADGRKPRRLQSDLDQTVKSLIRLPWYLRVFVVTDSEYVQQMLASHFPDSRFLPKRFSDEGPAGRFVHRHDPLDMRNFVTEVTCLAACWKIINIGGVINQDALHQRTVGLPYDRSLGKLQNLIAAGIVRR